ncbi:SurA N-terminal domain-containing protein [Cloacibacillus sp.]
MLRTMRNYTKVIMIIVILFFVASCFAGYGLYTRGNRGGGDGMHDYPVAEVNGRNVMRSELEKGAAQISEQYGNNVSSADIPQIRRAALDGIIIQGELQKEISNRKIDVPNDEINAAYTRAMDSYPTREEFMEFIKRSGLTEKQIKEDIKKQLQMQKLMESLEKDVAVDDKEVRAFYDTAKNFLYKQPAGVMVNIATFKDKAAAEAAQKAIAGGAKWDAEIEKYKNDIEMATSYDKPTIITDQMLQQKELAVLKDYPMNKVTPVESVGESHSYIAIKRSKSAERVLPFDEVSGDVTAVIKNQKMQQAQQKFYGELLSRANVKVLDASIFPEEKKPEAASANQTAPAASEDKKD